MSDFGLWATPLRTAEIELTAHIPPLLGGRAPDGTPYRGASVLVRLGGRPLGQVVLPLPATARSIVRAVSQQLGAGVARVPTTDGTETEDIVGKVGVSTPAAGACRRSSRSAATPAVSVVIATCGRPAQVVRCVDALLASDYPDFEIVVVDNGPQERIAAAGLAAQLGHDDRLRYIVEVRRGASRARNAGIAVSRGDVVAFTDDDVVVDGGWLAALGETFALDPEVACVTGLTLPYRLDTSAQRNFELIAGFGGGYRPLRFHRDMDPPPTRLFPFTSGIVGSSNNMAVRADVLARLGGFDVRLGPGTPVGGAEDLDLLTRILLNGGEVQYEPRVLVRHEHREADGALGRQIFSYGSGATAMLTKWAVASPKLRRQLGNQAWSIIGDLARHDVLRKPDVAQRSISDQPPSRLRRARVLGYACGPLLWLSALGRQVRRP